MARYEYRTFAVPTMRPPTSQHQGRTVADIWLNEVLGADGWILVWVQAQGEEIIAVRSIEETETS